MSIELNTIPHIDRPVLELGGRAESHLLERTMPAPPTRKRQLGMSMDRSSPKYQFWVMFSVLRTSALALGYACVAIAPREASASKT